MYDSWVMESIEETAIQHSLNQSQWLILYKVLKECGIEAPEEYDVLDVEKLADALEIAIYQKLIEGETETDNFELLCQHAFLVLRALPVPSEDLDRMKYLLKLSCIGVLGEKLSDTQTYLREQELSSDLDTENWPTEILLHCIGAFLCLVRKKDWSDLKHAISSVRELRLMQDAMEKKHLQKTESSRRQLAIELTALYHLAKAIELVVEYSSEGKPVGALIESSKQFESAIKYADAGRLAELSVLSTWMFHAGQKLGSMSIWKAIEKLEGNVSVFAKSIASLGRPRPILDLWPSQQQALISDSLLDPKKRAIVIEMPTSSGKTLLAEFKIVHARENFPNAWIAYIAPTRSLVNQVTIDLRESLGPLDIEVVKAVPIYEIDPMEEDSLQSEEFDVLVTTPEKLDLILRGEKVDCDKHPLGLVIFDEAQTIGVNVRNRERPLKAEMVLSAINERYPDTRFLLLTPFVPNAEDLANWLSQEEDSVIRIDWKPNEQIIGLVSAEGARRNWSLVFSPKLTSTPNVEMEGKIQLTTEAPLDKTYSSLAKYDIASLTAKVLSTRGNVVVYTQKASDTTRIAESICSQLTGSVNANEISLVQRFLQMEYGKKYHLVNYLDKGVAYHHGGVTEESRILIEWLMKLGLIKALVATTTIAYGMNLPISSLIMNSYKIGTPPAPMSANLFWNIAGRVGRAYQDILGLVLLVDKNETEALTNFIQGKATNLISSLDAVLSATLRITEEQDLEYWTTLYPELSSFIQFIGHLYRQTENHDLFVGNIEEILNSTLGYSSIRKRAPESAKRVLEACVSFTNQIQAYPPETLPIMDQTGFSPHTVKEVIDRTPPFTLDDYTSPTDLFHHKLPYVMRIAGVMITIRELDFKKPFVIQHEALGQLLSYWTRGRPMHEIAKLGVFNASTPLSKLTKYTQAIRRVSSLGSWGMGAIISMALRAGDPSSLDERKLAEIQSLPAMVYFGVDSLEAVALRSLGVPRLIAKGLGEKYRNQSNQEVPKIRDVRIWLKDSGDETWHQGLPEKSLLTGTEFKKVWNIFNGYWQIFQDCLDIQE
ncbi:MAG: DEAD/DEAH box helicase [Candidatus Thorarchaeota archaeon]